MFRPDIPDHFPGEEFSRSVSTDARISEFLYQICHVIYGETTSGHTITIPDIEYRYFADMKLLGFTDRYSDSSAGKVSISLLEQSQLEAINTAADINSQRLQEDPELNTFVHLRKISKDKNGLLYLCSPEDGGRLQGNEANAAVLSAQALGVVDFATSVWGYHGFFKYDEADIINFVPEHLKDAANAYRVIDEPRVAVGTNGEHDFHIAKIMLFNDAADMEFPHNKIAV